MTEPTQSAPQQAASPNSSPSPAASPNSAASAAPTPGSVNGDVPVETWRRDLDQVKEAPSAQRHELLSTLLDELDSQVGSL